jgi:hypothetical protein
MPIYKFEQNAITPLDETSFSEEKIKERQDLQRLLKDSIEVIAKDCLVIAEEFGEWTDSQRRIDLLAIDRDANLVVIELKRTTDGGHMELQSLRYAAMISAMTFQRAIEVFADYLGCEALSEAEEQLLAFLGWDEPSEEDFATDVRIVLASAESSKELTKAMIAEGRSFKLRQYFTAANDLFHIGGVAYAVIKQWGSSTQIHVV